MIIEYLFGLDESRYISIVELFVIAGIIEIFIIAGIVYYLFLMRREIDKCYASKGVDNQSEEK